MMDNEIKSNCTYINQKMHNFFIIQTYCVYNTRVNSVVWKKSYNKVVHRQRYYKNLSSTFDIENTLFSNQNFK